MRRYCTVQETEIENEDGKLIPGISAVCQACDHETFSFGTGQNSIRRCLVLMREECPLDEQNFYTESDG